jgi:integrase
MADGSRKVYFYYHGVRIKSDDPQTTAFRAEMDKVDKRRKKQENAPDRSLSGLFTLYRAGRVPDLPGEGHGAGRIRPFKDLAERTREDYAQVMDDFAGPAKSWLPDAMGPRDIEAICKVAGEKHGRDYGNKVLKVFRLVCSWAVYHKLADRNPCMGAPMIKRDKKKKPLHRPWTVEEFCAVWDASPSPLRIILGLVIFCGGRPQDARAIPWTAYDGAVIRWTTLKNDEIFTATVPDILKVELDKAPRKADTIAASSRGEPWSEIGVQRLFERIRNPLVTAEKIGKGLTQHGLRHTLGTWSAEAGASGTSIGHAPQR